MEVALEPTEYDYFMERLEQKKEGVKLKINDMIEDIFSRLSLEFSSTAFGVDHPMLTVHSRLDITVPVGACIEEATKKFNMLLLSTAEEVYSDYEQSLDVGDLDEMVDLVAGDMEMKTEDTIFETTEVKRRKRKVVKPSHQALICMNRPPEPTDKPFYCRWPECGHTSKNYYNIAKHVRYRHFHLPITKQEQEELNIIDSRDAFKFVGRLTAENPIMDILSPTEEESLQPEYSKPVKFFCKLSSCGRAFTYKSALIAHERTHLGVKPFWCKWELSPGTVCSFSSIKRNTVRRHVRQKHFKLPKTYKRQVALNIIDHRDPDDYIEEDIEKLSLL